MCLNNFTCKIYDFILYLVLVTVKEDVGMDDSIYIYLLFILSKIIICVCDVATILSFYSYVHIVFAICGTRDLIIILWPIYWSGKNQQDSV